MEINDVCVYGPTDLNKIGKIGRTSWDSFAYALLMGHNVYAHIKAVQDGNELYDQGVVPAMLRHDMKSRNAFRQLIDAIFSAKSRGEALALVDTESKWYLSMPGSSANGMIGKKALNGHSKAKELMDIEAQPKIKPLPKEVTTIVDAGIIDLPPPVKKKQQLKKNGKSVSRPIDIFNNHPIDDSGLDESALTTLEESV
jgi:hypothetical protein